VLTGLSYRGARLTRAIVDRAYSELWKIADEDPRPWNDAIREIDARSEGDPPSRVVCAVCGDFELLGYCKDTEQRLVANRRCFKCNFWEGMAKSNGEPSAVVIAGHRYTIRPDNHPEHGSFYGFGGQEFKIRFFDGREVTTKNLWSNGEVPIRFRAIFPENAEWVRP
jgi:hypothetical protein